MLSSVWKISSAPAALRLRFLVLGLSRAAHRIRLGQPFVGRGKLGLGVRLGADGRPQLG